MDELRPIVKSTIIDKSFYTNEVTNNSDDIVLGVITADKGIDSKLIKINSPKQLLDEFTLDGKPNYKIHGQPVLDLLGALENGATARVMRVVPENATLPNGVISVQAKSEEYGLDIITINAPTKVKSGAVIHASSGEGETPTMTALDNGTLSVVVKNTTKESLKYKVHIYDAENLAIQEIAKIYSGTAIPSNVLQSLGTPLFVTAEQTLGAGVTASALVIGTAAVIDTGAGAVDTPPTGVTLTGSNGVKKRLAFLLVGSSNEKSEFISARPYVSSEIEIASAPVLTNVETTFTNKRLLIRPLVLSMKDLKSRESFVEFVESYADEFTYGSEVDLEFESGSKVLPLFGFVARSKEASNYKISLVPTSKYDTSYSFRTYELSVLKSDVNGNYSLVANGGPFIVSFSPTALNESGKSMFIKDVLDTYFSELDFIFNEDNYETLMTGMGELINNSSTGIIPDANLNPELVDFLFNTPYNNKKASPYYSALSLVTNILSNTDDNTELVGVTEGMTITGKVDTSLECTLRHFAVEVHSGNLSMYTASPVNYIYVNEVLAQPYSYVVSNYHFILENGSAGSWTGETAAEKEENRKLRIAEGYSGLIDPDILNSRLTPFDLVFDSNQGSVVRAAIEGLINVRKDLFGFFSFDVADGKSYPTNLSYKLSNYDFDNYRIALFAQNEKIVEKYTGRVVTVSASNLLARKVASSSVNLGYQVPIAGENFGVIGDNSVNLSYIPNELQQEQMYENRVNYILKDESKTWIETQLTTQAAMSALSDIPTVRVLLKVVRETEKISSLYKYSNLNNPSVLEELQSKVVSKIEEVSRGLFSSINAEVYQSEYDKIRKRTRMKLELSSPKFLEQIILDFIIK